MLVEEEKCRNCYIPLEYYKKRGTEVEGRCKPCADFLKELLLLSNEELEEKLLSRNCGEWSDGCFGVFCDEYRRRKMPLPQ